ncbi:MAG TPA: phytanoyl-CoA dioxygenase family protein [Chloroflexota bacterium]|nr:phytanoyl-CoA dioxygenase family protein [Chloroflexota bacterium]
MAISSLPITEEKMLEFEEQGFVRFDDVLSADEVSAFRGAVAEATGQPGLGYTQLTSSMFTQYVNVWRTNPEVQRHVFNRRLAEIARQLSKSTRVRLWHDQLIAKMPGNQSTNWHHDVPLWPMIEPGALTCWLAFVDVTVEMGAMQFVPGSHRWGRLAITSLPPHILYDVEGMRLLVPDDKRDLLKPVVFELKAGSCTFHNSLTLHWTRPNTTDRARLGFIINYMPDGVRYSGQKHIVTDPLNLQVGQSLVGDLFPILASSDEAEIAGE